MDTQTIVALAVAINVAVAVAAIVLPSLSQRRGRASAARRRAALAATVGPAPARDFVSDDPFPATGAPRGDDPRPATDPDTEPVDAAAGAPWFAQSEAGSADVAADASTPGGVGVAAVDWDVDPQTGFDRDLAWTRWLQEEEARVRRFRRPATIVLIDLTGLDRFAERVGDEAAARLIPPIAVTMRRFARQTDHLARLGPTRFAALLTETDEVRAINFVERIRSACDVWLESGAVAVRLSIGWADMGASRTAAVAVAEAENRLFLERQRGRAEEARTSQPGGNPPLTAPSPS